MHVVIMGCGRSGSRLAQHLSRQGHSVAVIDRNPTAFHLLGADFDGTTVTGVGFDSNALIEAGIERADAFVAVSSGDNTNLVSSKVAKDVFQVPRVIARIYDPRRAEIYKRMGIPTVAPVTWGVNTILDYLFVGGVTEEELVRGGEIEMLELDIHIPGKLAGRKVSEFEIPDQIKVISIERRDEAFIPGADTTFEKGDLAHVCVHRQHMDRMRETFFSG